MAQKTCDHQSCKCPVTEGQRFCSDACRDLASSSQAQGSRCGCDHPPCAAQNAPT